MNYDVEKLRERLRIVERERDVLRDTLAKFQQESAKLPAMLQETVNNYKTLNRSLEEELVSVRSECDELKAQVSDLKARLPEGSVTPPENSNDSLRHIIQKLTS